MLLSVIIVNYKVKCFLLQTLSSVYEAIKYASQHYGYENFEVFVVDNHSQDNTQEVIAKHFSQVVYIQNDTNLGFAKANNQALRISKGKYKLLLNPDTIIPEQCFSTILQYIENQNDIGALGVRMTDIHGVFATESKRNVPSISGSFYKLTGLYKLFPDARRLGHYHLNHLSQHERADIQVVSGAFMFLRAEALNKAGLLDETFFMYGEDIDLSYRILKAGYRNVYFPDISIIHYKGESSKLNTTRYIDAFYDAMYIFAKKHYSTFASTLIRPSISLVKAIKKYKAKTQKPKTEDRATQSEKTQIYLSNTDSIAESTLLTTYKHLNYSNLNALSDSEKLESEIIIRIPDISFADIILLCPLVSRLRIHYPKFDCII